MDAIEINDTVSVSFKVYGIHRYRSLGSKDVRTILELRALDDLGNPDLNKHILELDVEWARKIETK